MSKQWFIFFRDRHLGPFSKEEVLLRLNSKKINLDTTVWRQGMDGWCEIGKCHDFFPPPPMAKAPIKPRPKPDLKVVEPPIPLKEEIELPPLPIEEEEDVLPAIPAEAKVETEVEEAAFVLPPIPAQEEEPPVEVVLQVVSEIKEVPSIAIFQSRKILYWKILLATIPMAVLILWILLLTSSRPFEVPAGLLGPDAVKRLYTVVSSESEEIRIEVQVSTDQKKLVLASNYDGTAELYMTLSSYRGKVLSNSQSVLTATGNLENHLAIFTDLRIEEGEGMVPGLYMIQVRGVKSGAWIRFLKFLRNIQPFRSLSGLQQLNDRFNYRGDLLYNVSTDSELTQKLKKFKAEQKKELSKPLLELVERYRTYGAIVEMLNELFRNSLKRFKEPGAVHLFEKDYIQKIAPLYQSITIENQKIQVSLIETDEELSQEYQKLVEYGRQIGQLVIEINDRLKKYRKLKSKNRLELLLTFQGKLNELEELGKMRIHKLQENLANI